ncbi:MAG TPA: TonB-dependent receptor, partial [Vicinamibacterales bacterium]|nr:TonB-dependent receptor [Vicinamibacterales bacterium]
MTRREADAACRSRCRSRARSIALAAIAFLTIAPLAVRPAQAQASRAPAAPAQAPAAPAQSARLVLTVTDTSGGVIPTATVTVTGIESATSALPVAPVSTTAQGVATVAGLAPGRYSIRAEFQGLETTTIPDVRLRAGDNRLTMVMALPKLQDSVSVAVDQQTNAADRRQTFGTALTREQIDALSDDPDEMRRQLQEIAGMDAVIRVDSFEGAALPPKAQIKSIHVTRDAFAAENHFAGGLFIDIITQPGIGPVRGGLNFRLRDGSLSGKNPFTVRKGPEQTQNFGGNVGGSIAKERTSFSLSVNGTNSYSTSILNAHVPAGEIAANIPRRVPNDNVFTSALLDHAITKDQTLRISFNQSRFSSSNLGMGQYDLPERAYSTSDNYWGVRLQEVGPLGRRFFINSRLSIGVSDSSSNSLTQAPTIVVTEAFTNGGAQRAGGRHSTQVTAGSDLDYVRGIHSVRAGVALDGYSYRSDDRTNYLGTYTFASLDEYDAGRALSYTQRIGDPLVEYGYMTSAVYLQDDIRLRRNLTISPGVRYEAMLHVNDYDNIGPRFGITWAPFKSGRTSLRGSVGIFYEWMAATTYEQTLRVDGYRQRELNIQNPPFNPDTLSPGEGGFTPPTNRYLFNDDLELQMTKRVSVGIDQTLSPRLRVSLTYAFMRGANLWRGQNQNAPVDGVRPDAEFANIVQIVADGRSQQQSLNANFSLNLARLGNAGGAPVAVRAA